jgi:segregation and condensation protein A
VTGTTISRLGLDLDLDVFSGPFDLLLALILREEIDLLELDLAEIVLAYLAHIEARGELDLESATEFILLVASLLELKSRLLLPGEEAEELLELTPEQAADELLARMLGVRRFGAAGAHLQACLQCEAGVRYRAAPVPRELRREALEQAAGTGDRELLARAVGRLLQVPPPIDVRHMCRPRVTVAQRLAHLRALLRRGRFTFDEAVNGDDRATVAVTLLALLELRRCGEADWEQSQPFGEITITACASLPSSAAAVPVAATATAPAAAVATAPVAATAMEPVAATATEPVAATATEPAASSSAWAPVPADPLEALAG